MSHSQQSRQITAANTPFADADIDGVILTPLSRYDDERGWLCELYRDDEVAAEYHPVMGYLSVTLPHVVRGPHEHVDQSDLFAFLGPGDFCLYLWDARPDSGTYRNRIKLIVGASSPYTAVIPPGVVHAYQNVSDHPGTVINLPNRLYRGEGRREEVDEIRHEIDPDSPYTLF